MPKKTGDIQLEVEGISNWALLWEARAKLVAAIFFIFGVISLQTTIFALLAFLIVFSVALLMGLSFVFLLGRYLLIAPFILLMTIPLVIGSGFPLDPERVSFASLIILKAVTAMTIMTILLHTQTQDQFINSLAHLKVPSIVITILLLSYRYVFLFIDDIQKMQLALKTRFFKGGIGIKSLKTYSHLTGFLLLKSLDRSENVYNAMAARGFNGSLRFGIARSLNKRDFYKTTLSLFIIITLLTIEHVYFS